MRLLELHCDFINFKAKSKALKSLPDLMPEELKEKRFENVLVVFTSIEQGDDEEVVSKAVEQVKKNFDQVKASSIVVYPYAHLSSNLADPKIASALLEKLKQSFAKVAKTDSAPFGYYKEFELKCKGHPLAELSKTIRSENFVEKLATTSVVKPGAVEMKTPASNNSKDLVESESLKQEDAMKSVFQILDVDGSLKDVEKFDFKKFPKLRQLADYEIKKVRAYSQEPRHLKLMREHELVDREEGSDSGNLRWYPKGVLIKRLLEQKATEASVNYGAVEVETPIMYDFEHPSLKKYLNRFPARQYVVQSDDKNFFLRFAACFGQFLEMHDMTISYKQLPMKVFELARYAFRREKSGEVSGLRRLRAFTMPDMHSLCQNLEQAREEFGKQYDLCRKWMADVRLPFEAAFRIQKEFFDENKKFYIEMVKKIGRPVLVELFDIRYAYFITKFEFNFMDPYGKATALSTVQIDVENAQTYDLNVVSEKGDKFKPVVLHASVSGAVERNLFALLEQQGEVAEANGIAMLPLWLAPTQIRLLPVGEKHVESCDKLAEKLALNNIRVDVDDRNEKIGAKIRDAEKGWIPFIIVIGDKEQNSDVINVRIRSEKIEKQIKIQELVRLIESETKEFPFQKLSLSIHLSKRPKFVG